MSQCELSVLNVLCDRGTQSLQSGSHGSVFSELYRFRLALTEPIGYQSPTGGILPCAVYVQTNHLPITNMNDHRILVPVAVLDGQSVPTTIIEAFATIPVLLLGYHEIPDQTSPGQARDQYGEQAKRELEERRSVFEDAGCPVTSRLVFTHDRFETFERVAVEAGCNAVLILNPVPVLETMLVAIRGDVNVGCVARLVATVLEGTEIEVTLFHVVPEKRKRGQGEELLQTAASAFADAGVDSDCVSRSVVVADSPTPAILEAAEDHDFIVAGESRPSIRRYVFRDRAEQIAKRTSDPVLVVRGEYLEGENEADDAETTDAEYDDRNVVSGESPDS